HGTASEFTRGRDGEGIMAGTSPGLLVGAALLSIAALTAATAETIPLPIPAPLPKEGAATAPKQAPTAQSCASGLAAGLKSLFHLAKQPEPPPPVTTTAPITTRQ